MYAEVNVRTNLEAEGVNAGAGCKPSAEQVETWEGRLLNGQEWKSYTPPGFVWAAAWPSG